MSDALHDEGLDFSLEFFRGQVPWYGPYLTDLGHDMIVSSALRTWPQSVDYSLIGWVFDAAGHIVAAKVLLERRRAGVPVTVALRDHFGDLPPQRGMVALLMRAADPAAEVPLSAETWSFSILGAHGVREIIATDSSTSVNFPERSGRRATFRLFSGELLSDREWHPLACILNPSVNPAYATLARLSVIALNEKGERLEASGGTVPPFGCRWIDVAELFGSDLGALLAGSNSRGSYLISSDDAGCYGYHFLYSTRTHKFGGDHTRPLMAYLPKGYGAISRGFGASLRNSIGSVAHFAASRLMRPRHDR